MSAEMIVFLAGVVIGVAVSEAANFVYNCVMRDFHNGEENDRTKPR